MQLTDWHSLQHSTVSGLESGSILILGAEIEHCLFWVIWGSLEWGDSSLVVFGTHHGCTASHPKA
jgi:hypothetical protein